MKVKALRRLMHRGIDMAKDEIYELEDGQALKLIEQGYAVDLPTAKKMARDELDELKAAKTKEIKALEAEIDGVEEEPEVVEEEPEVEEEEEEKPKPRKKRSTRRKRG